MSLNLRRKEGIIRAEFRTGTGFDAHALAGARIGPLVEHGLLADDGERVFLTRRGRYVADAVIEELLRC